MVAGSTTLLLELSGSWRQDHHPIPYAMHLVQPSGFRVPCLGWEITSVITQPLSYLNLYFCKTVYCMGLEFSQSTHQAWWIWCIVSAQEKTATDFYTAEFGLSLLTKMWVFGNSSSLDPAPGLSLWTMGVLIMLSSWMNQILIPPSFFFFF